MTHAAEPVPTAPLTPATQPSPAFSTTPTGQSPTPPATYVPINPSHTSPHPSLHVSARPVGKRRGAWAVWWLSGLTFGIYYLVWYAKINSELARFAPEAVTVNPTLAWLSQFVPIVDLVSLANTAGRLNAASASIGSPIRVSGGMTILSTFWFGSQTRYLQRRLNGLWDATQTAVQHAR